jgi:hypothetical protein
MLRLGVVLILFLSLVAFLGFARASSARSRPVAHTCGLTDRQFLTVYDLQLQAVGMYGTDYMNGDAKAQDAIAAAKEAAIAVKSSAPFDPTLQTVKHLAPPMFLEFGRAVKLRSAGKDASPAMYRAYSLSARVRDVLTDAQPKLSALGCDVSDVL